MGIRAAHLLLAAAALSLATPSASSAKPSGPKAPARVAATLSGTSLAVTWTPATSGRVEIKVRAKPPGRKARTKTSSANAAKGRLTAKVTGPTGAALATTAVSLRARRCTGAGKRRRCGAWGRSIRPSAPKLPGPVETPATTPTPPNPGPGPTLAGCPMLPAGHSLNQDVSTLPLDPRSDAYVRNIGLGGHVHPDFGAADLGQGPGGFGIPYRVVPANEPLVPTIFGDYADESDPGPYPIPLDTKVEGGPDSNGDRHVLVVREGECRLYELGNAYPRDGRWDASGGAVWDLATGVRTTGAHPGWTSVDAAGLPVLPGLVRYDEVAAGVINHAVRFTISRTQRAYIAPASHWASSITDQDVAPMGLRLRMRADYDLSRFRGQSLVIATALKRYGMIVADNGSNWFISGAPDTRWDDEDLNQLKGIPGSAFEAVQTGAVVRP